MSRENVELLQECYRSANEGGFDAIADFLDHAFEMDAPQGLESRVARDKTGFRDWFQKMDEIWEELRFEPREISEVDSERVIAVVRVFGRASGTGIRLDQDLTHLWTLRQGKAVRVNTYLTKHEALEVAGVPSQGGD